jgi:dTDP-4-dehydrorhamnose reductase
VRIERALVTGGGGQLGSDLEDQLGAASVEVRAPGRSDLDVTDDAAVAESFESFGPDLVVNCAAFHNLDVCEREEDRSFEVNARAVKRLAQRCAAAGARFVPLSTNYVFDGSGAEPYSEEDMPNPRSVYAISKLAGEHAALAYARGALVVRTAGLYGLHGSASKGGNFVTRMIERGRDQGSLTVVADQLLSPTYTGDLAAAVIEAVDAGAEGVVHLTASGSGSWHDFTAAIVELAGLDVPVEPSATVIAPGAADRPLNGVLARPRADALGLTPLRHWRGGLERYMTAAGLAAAPA